MKRKRFFQTLGAGVLGATIVPKDWVTADELKEEYASKNAEPLPTQDSTVKEHEMILYDRFGKISSIVDFPIKLRDSEVQLVKEENSLHLAFTYEIRIEAIRRGNVAGGMIQWNGVQFPMTIQQIFDLHPGDTLTITMK